MTFMLSNGRSYRLGVALTAALISSAGFNSGPCWAKHKSQLTIPSDPCAKMNGYMTKRVNDMKGLKKTIDKEQSVPNTVAGIFDLMQGKPYVDQPKTQKLAEMRREANDLNETMRASGCTAVNIDEEMAKPEIPTLPTPTRKGKGKGQGEGLEADIPLRSNR
ncbi:hypothetical protein HYPDE_33723 [Hyphomicrobium denitrificans 1NES1]|uniref:Uncharacterized protein n=1 Tax=Hyphomicrobium denitrificans 1NES1 TaxID=670307 RepID=N0B850_9HYPH|nr:hypothetical protein [Hyphomicrobium denitrificans]AGK58417.1 hypothetical protein HYPDE_33723 [Hyphomicrobium denitrificans 1NES1]